MSLNSLPPSPSPSPSFDYYKFDILPSPTVTDDPLAGPSIEKRASRLDQDFNYQVVVFEVENTLFQVPRIGFNVPGSPFEAMFALPQTQTDDIEGSSLDNPIQLSGVKVHHFRPFLRVLYPFVGQKPVIEFDEWVGVLNLATMWFFKKIRTRAITELSDLIKVKTVMERFRLAKEYRVADWLRNAYLELTQKLPLDLEELRPAEPYSDNWDAIKWEATSMDWETIARILHLQTKLAASGPGYEFTGTTFQCYECGGLYGQICKCRVLPMVNEAFRGELEGLREDPGPDDSEHPLSPNSTVNCDVDGGSGKKKKKVKR